MRITIAINKKDWREHTRQNPRLQRCPGCGRPVFGHVVCPLCEAKRRAEQAKANQGKEA